MKNCIAKMRKERGLTLQALADRVGASNQQISHLEKGRRGLTVDWLERIAIALDCHPFDLLAPTWRHPPHQFMVLIVQRSIQVIIRCLNTVHSQSYIRTAANIGALANNQ